MTHPLAPLLDVLPGARLIGEAPSAIAGITADSRAVRAGTLFVALGGTRTDGHGFVAAAAAAGASIAVVERELAGIALPQIVVRDSKRAFSRLADAYYGHPSQALSVIGVTGTNGKTTTTHLIVAMLEAAGIRCGVIGTLGGALGDRRWPLENTTPLALDLHAMLADMRDAGASAVAMEVSSHALALHRVDDVRFAVGAFTNLTRDHLDFHGTLERYAAAKRSLFELAPRAVLNLDDPYGAAWERELPAAIGYAIDAPDADLQAVDVELASAGSRFRVAGVSVELALPGRFNVRNALAAFGVGRALGLADATIARGLGDARAVPGRMERIGALGIDAIVDYAHTPDALENVLRAAREMTRRRLIVVFGCGGDRDPGKRAIMGEIAARLADRVIVTSDNPRSEDPAAIAQAVAERIDAEIVLDRRAAIRRAIGDAAAGDTIVVAGKGHEPYQIVGASVLPFDDRDEVRAALANRASMEAAR